MSIPCSQILDSFPQLLAHVSGNRDVMINGVSPSENGAPQSVLFVSNEKNFLKALQSPAAVLVVPESHKDKAAPFIGSKTLLSSANPSLAMAMVLDRFFNPRQKTKGIHSTAVIHPSAQLGKNVGVGPFVVIEENVVIGDDTEIMSHVFIGAATVIGSQCEFQPHSTIASEGYGFAHDKQGHHHRIPQIGRVVIGDRVAMGAGCTIDRATFAETKIGSGTKFDNMVHIAHNCVIGENCLLAAGVMLAGSTLIGNNVTMGGQCGATGHQKIGDNTQFGGRAGIRGDVLEAGAYGGFPLEPVRTHLKTMASIKKLTGTIKDVRKILKHLGLESASKDD